jgi:hypothetical protein
MDMNKAHKIAELATKYDELSHFMRVINNMSTYDMTITVSGEYTPDEEQQTISVNTKDILANCLEDAEIQEIIDKLYNACSKRASELYNQIKDM